MDNYFARRSVVRKVWSIVSITVGLTTIVHSSLFTSVIVPNIAGATTGNWNYNSNSNHNSNRNSNDDSDNSNHNSNRNSNKNSNKNSNRNSNHNSNSNGNSNSNHNSNSNGNSNHNSNSNSNSNHNSNTNSTPKFCRLELTKSVNAGEVATGSVLTYTITYKNTGYANCTGGGVRIDDAIPAGLTYNGVHSEVTMNDAGNDGIHYGYQYIGYGLTANNNLHAGSQLLSWNANVVSPGESGTITFQVTVDQFSACTTKTFINTAKAYSDQTFPPAVVSNGVTTVASSACTYAVSIDKTGPAKVTPGQNITYPLAWSVVGNSQVNQVVVTDAIPANTSFVSADNNGSFSNGVVTWNLGTKNSGDQGVVMVTVKVASPLQNGTVISNAGCIDTAQTEKLCDTTTTTVESSPLISIVKSNNVSTFTNPGKTVTYTVTVTNATTATENALNVALTDVLPNGFTFVDGGSANKTFGLGIIAPGQSVTRTYDVQIGAAVGNGTYINTATAKGDNTESVSDTSDVTVRIPEVLSATTNPDLTISKKVSKSTAKPNDIVTYTLTIKNIGTGDAENVVVTDTLPKNLSFANFKGRTHQWFVGTLKAGAVTSISYDVRVESDAKRGSYKNTAVVKADDVSARKAVANLEVRIPTVLGAELPVTGTGPTDYATFMIGGILLALGILGLRKRGTSNDGQNFLNIV